MSLTSAIPESVKDDLLWINEHGKSHPVWWIETVLGMRLYQKQRDLVDAILHNDRIACKGGHGTGKGWCMSAIACWWVLCIGGYFIAIRSPYQMLLDSWWADTQKLIEGSMFPGFPLNDRWLIGRKNGVICINTDKPTNVPGLHEKNIMIMADEAPGIPDEIFNVLEGAQANRRKGGLNAKLIMLGQPIPNGGYFQKAFSDSSFTCLTFSCYDSPNVTGEMDMPGLVSKDWIQERLEKWGPNDPQFKVRVQGEFPEAGAEDRICPDAILRIAQLGEPHIPEVCPEDLRQMTAQGADIAGAGGNMNISVIIRAGKIINVAEKYGAVECPEVAEWLQRRHEEYNCAITGVDVTGLGWGVAGELKARGITVIGVNFAASPNNRVRYADMRTELYATCIDDMRYGSLKMPEGVTPREVFDDFAAHTYKITGSGIQLLPKDQIKKKLRGRSPDYSDATVIARKAHRSIRVRDPRTFAKEQLKVAIEKYRGRLAYAGRF